MAALKKNNISFNPPGRSIDVLSGTSILDAARFSGINISAPCGGKGSCGNCLVIISEGETSPLKNNEKKLIGEDDINAGYRLACSTCSKGDIKVTIPEKSLITGMKLQVEGQDIDIEADPVIECHDISLQKPSIENPVDDLQGVLEYLRHECGIENVTADINAVKQLPSLLRSNGWELAVFLRHNEIVGFCPAKERPVGFAVDMGTTKIAAYLMDLAAGKELACTGAINPQTVYGDDVMSRLDSALRCKKAGEAGTPKLAAVIRGLLNEMIVKLTEEAGLSPYHVADICIVGNTAMTHLFLDLPVGQLACSPYVAASCSAVDVKARDVEISASPGAYVHILPGIGGFVGADHVSMILASDIDRTDRVTLGVDIGTNTEIVLSVPEKKSLVSLSCPSGPAFEGAHVTDGMRAADGAIEKVRLTDEGVEIVTIGNAPAVGLCGSGIIDAVSELYRWGLIDERGRFDKENKRISPGKNGSEFVLVKNEKNNIVVSQKDIAEIQLAKGAIMAGIEALMEVSNITGDMVEEVIIAGAFGSYIDLVNAVDIALLPAFSNARYSQAGNSAGIGAKMALVSEKERKRAMDIAARSRFLELTTHRSFSRRFAGGMRFPEKGQIVHMHEKNNRKE